MAGPPDSAPQRQENDDMPQYLLLLHSDPTGFQRMSPQDMQAAVQKYVKWGDRLRQSGVYKESHKLANDRGRAVQGAGEKTRVTDGPYSETKEILGGYFLIEAPSYDRAIEELRDCPHLAYGTVEVRQIDTM